MKRRVKIQIDLIFCPPFPVYAHVTAGSEISDLLSVNLNSDQKLFSLYLSGIVRIDHNIPQEDNHGIENKSYQHLFTRICAD